MKLSVPEGASMEFEVNAAVAGEALDAMATHADGVFSTGREMFSTGREMFAIGRRCWRSVQAFVRASYTLHRAARAMRATSPVSAWQTVIDAIRGVEPMDID